MAKRRGPIPGPRSLTETARRRLLEALREGASRRMACDYAGISASRLSDWMSSDEPVYREIAEQVKKAEAEAERKATAAVLKAMPTHWQAGAWWLERRRPEDYAKQDRLIVESQVERQLAEMLAALSERLSPEEYQRVVEALNE